MKLTVLGSESVEALTRLVQQTFHRVPNHNAPEPTYQPDEYDTSGDDGEDTDAGSEEREKPFSVASNTVGRFFKVAPIKPEHSLVLTWACPPLSSYSSTSSFSGSMPTTHNPDQYLSYLLGMILPPFYLPSTFLLLQYL